jgi:hypothetical protein
MSEITEKIQAYKASGEGWPELLEWLAAHEYTPAKRYDDPKTGPLDEADWDYPFVDGSWDEVDKARAVGDLTRDEFAQVVERKHELATA